MDQKWATSVHAVAPVQGKAKPISLVFGPRYVLYYIKLVKIIVLINKKLVLLVVILSSSDQTQ